MKTKDLIALLQREDPTGESHVRMNGGVPIFVESKPGYYDGPYSYIDKDGNFVISALNSKVDIYTVDLEEYVSDLVLDGKTLTEILNMVKFEFSCYHPSSSQEKKDRYIKIIKQAFNEITKKD
jgi:hypothetical protein